MAISRWDAKLAREQIQVFLDRQLPSGGFDDVVWEKAGPVEAFGKPPVLPWVAAIIDRRCPDDEYLKRVYPKFAANAKFWERERGGEKEGLFHYGGSGPNMEAGWDDSVRWDHGCDNLWTIDLNCYMIMAYRSLAYMADRLGLPGERRQWLAKADALGKRVNEALWSDAEKAYVDRDRTTKKFTRRSDAGVVHAAVRRRGHSRAGGGDAPAGQRPEEVLSRLPLGRLRQSAV